MMMFGHKKTKTEEPNNGMLRDIQARLEVIQGRPWGVSSSELQELIAAVRSMEIELRELSPYLKMHVDRLGVDIEKRFGQVFGKLDGVIAHLKPDYQLVAEPRPMPNPSAPAGRQWSQDDIALLGEHKSENIAQLTKLFPTRTPGGILFALRKYHGVGQCGKGYMSSKNKGRGGLRYTAEEDAELLQARTYADFERLAKKFMRGHKATRDRASELRRKQREQEAGVEPSPSPVVRQVVAPVVPPEPMLDPFDHTEPREERRRAMERQLIVIGLKSPALMLEIVASELESMDFTWPTYRHCFNAMRDAANAPMGEPDVHERCRAMKNEEVRKEALFLFKHPIPEPAEEIANAIIARMLKERPRTP